jgi:hypothetical protein
MYEYIRACVYMFVRAYNAVINAASRVIARITIFSVLLFKFNMFRPERAIFRYT